MIGGTPEGVGPLLAELPPAPWVVRETPATLLPVLQKAFPEAKVFPEFRMEVTRATFKPCHRPGRARRLVDADVAQLADFSGAPPQAAPSFLPWIRGACLMGIFEGEQLVATASTFVQTPEVWELVAIKTRSAWRGKGYASEVTSALTAVALESTASVTLSVLQKNAPALALYRKLGFTQCEERIWFDNGANSSPEF